MSYPQVWLWSRMRLIPPRFLFEPFGGSAASSLHLGKLHGEVDWEIQLSGGRIVP